jgi:hypothetical protein
MYVGVCMYVCMYVCAYLCVCVCVKCVFQFSIKRLLDIYIFLGSYVDMCPKTTPGLRVLYVHYFHFQSKLEYVDNFSISGFIKACKQFPGFFVGTAGQSTLRGWQF